jgi:hypothetical protein
MQLGDAGNAISINQLESIEQPHGFAPEADKP